MRLSAIPAAPSKARACPGTSTSVRRSDDRTTTHLACWMAPRRGIAAWPAHPVSRRTGAWRPKRSTGACSLPHSEALSLQAAYGDHQIGAFENFDQSVEDPLVVLRLRPQVFFKYELGFVDRLKCQLLISHPLHPTRHKRTNASPTKGSRNQAAFEKYPRLFDTIDQLFVTRREPERRNGGDFLVLRRMAF